MQAEATRTQLQNAVLSGILFTLNLPDNTTTRAFVTKIFGKMMTTMIDLAVEFDQRIEVDGIQSATKWVAEMCGTPTQAFGVENIPLDGPVLMAANHPGYFDSTVLFSQFSRQDIKALVAVSYFNYLPHAKPHVIYTDNTLRGNVKAVRESIKHLQDGGLLLLFPTGLSDPDPDINPEETDQFDAWSESISLLLRKVPSTQLVLTMISGIVSKQYLNHPIARIQPNPRYRQRVAEFFQIYDQFMRRQDTPLGRPRVSFSSPLRLPDLTNNFGESVQDSIRILMQQLLAAHVLRLE